MLPSFDDLRSVFSAVTERSEAALRAYATALRRYVRFALVAAAALLPLPIVGFVFKVPWLLGLFLLGCGTLALVGLAFALPLLVLAQTLVEVLGPVRRALILLLSLLFWLLAATAYTFLVPIGTSPVRVLVVVVLACVLALGYAVFGIRVSPRVAVGLAMVCFVLVTLGSLLPQTRAAAASLAESIDGVFASRLQAYRAPKRIDPRNHPLFDPVSGQPQAWFWRSPEGEFEFFDHAGFHPLTGAPLRAVSAETYEEWRRGKEEAERERRSVAEREAAAAERARAAAAAGPTATPTATPVPTPAPSQLDAREVSFHLTGCEAPSSAAVCNFMITNRGTDRWLTIGNFFQELSLSFMTSYAVDDQGNKLPPHLVSLGDETREFHESGRGIEPWPKPVGSISASARIPPGVPMRARLKFEGVAAGAQRLTLVSIGCGIRKQYEYDMFRVEFREVPLQRSVDSDRTVTDDAQASVGTGREASESQTESRGGSQTGGEDGEPPDRSSSETPGIGWGIPRDRRARSSGSDRPGGEAAGTGWAITEGRHARSGSDRPGGGVSPATRTQELMTLDDADGVCVSATFSCGTLVKLAASTPSLAREAVTSMRSATVTMGTSRISRLATAETSIVTRWT